MNYIFIEKLCYVLIKEFRCATVTARYEVMALYIRNDGNICDVTCQNVPFVTEISRRVR